VQPLSPSLSDSVDLAEFLAANRRRSPGWLDALNHVPSPHGSSPTALNASALTFTNPNPNDSTQHVGSTFGEHTPATSRYPADVTAMGSPIPVDTDDSDANINQLISCLQTSRGCGEQTAASNPPIHTGTAAWPRHRTLPPPPPTPALVAPRATPPVPSPQPVASCRILSPAAGGRAPHAATGSVGVGAFPSAHASSSRIPGSVNGTQNSPFGRSHNATGIAAEHTATQLQQQHSDARNTTQATDTSAPPTTYSSALMQALSRMEGEGVLNSQWTSSAHPSRTYNTNDAAGDASGGGVFDDDDDDATMRGSSAYPPDIYEEAMRAKVAKQQWMALEKARQEVLEEARRRRDCPFAPQVSPYAARLHRPTSLRPENRVQSEIIRRKQWLAKKRQQEVERELQECTFRPLTVRAAQLDPAALAPAEPVVFDALYAEAEERRTFETEVKPQLVQQAEGRVPLSPMRPEQLAAMVERLCVRGVVRTTTDAEEPREEGGRGVSSAAPYPASSSDANAAAAAVTVPDAQQQQRQPLLSAVSQRIVAAKVAAGERDPDIVRHLYRQAERDALKDQLRFELDEEKQRIARAEQAMMLAQDRRRLQQEYYRSVLAAKYKALAKHACDAQHTSYRATAPQPVALLARASFDLLSTEETEELLSAVEHCGQHKLREAEFIAVVFRFFEEHGMGLADATLLTRPPPAAVVVGGGAANAKRAGSASRSGGIRRGSSSHGSPVSLPRVKREKPDPELIAQIRESRALALESWKQEHQRKRAIADGVAVDDDFTFQPPPRRLIPYECRPDVVVPVKMTKSEALRRAYIAARHHDANALVTVSIPAPKTNTCGCSTIGTPATEQASTARELFSRLATSETLSTRRGSSVGAPPRARSCSGPSAAGTKLISTTQRERSAAGASTSPGPRPESRATSVGTRGPSRSPPQHTLPASAPSPIPKPGVATTSVSGETTVPLPRRQPVSQQRPSPSPAAACNDTVNPMTEVKPAEPTTRPRVGGPPSSSLSLVEQIMQSTPEERARLGRELLLRQLRDHQRRRSV
jgi:hypothetical protein